LPQRRPDFTAAKKNAMRKALHFAHGTDLGADLAYDQTLLA
jgi:hypothetical protein